MIFSTCGSSNLAFPRMMEALGALPAQQLYVQHGPSEPPPCAEAYDYLPYGQLVSLIERADVVVTHAGVGSILCSLRAGHVPIVFPRLRRFSEALDDHQVELAEALEARGTVVVARGAEELALAVANPRPRGPAAALQAEQFSQAVRSAIYGTGSQRRRLLGWRSWWPLQSNWQETAE